MRACGYLALVVVWLVSGRSCTVVLSRNTHTPPIWNLLITCIPTDRKRNSLLMSNFVMLSLYALFFTLSLYFSQTFARASPATSICREKLAVYKHIQTDTHTNTPPPNVTSLRSKRERAERCFAVALQVSGQAMIFHTPRASTVRAQINDLCARST